MALAIIPLLSSAEVQQLTAGLDQCVFADGRMTAKGLSKTTKDNLQVDRAAKDTRDLDRIVLGAIARSTELQSFAFPKRVMAPIFSKYEPGMHYGSHVDKALMGGTVAEPLLRTDFSMTVFLSPPGSYDGGELVVEMDLGTEEVKLSAGEAVVYPSTSIHHVAEVTRGVRMAAVTWMQSVVRDASLRDILRDLGAAIPLAAKHGDPQLQLRLGKSYNNLLRYAAEP